jgi:hypothetical protein
VGRGVLELKDTNAVGASTTPSSWLLHDLRPSTNEGLVWSCAFEVVSSSILMEFKVVVVEKKTL